jgi:hypothetical protein
MHPMNRSQGDLIDTFSDVLDEFEAQNAVLSDLVRDCTSTLEELEPTVDAAQIEPIRAQLVTLAALETETRSREDRTITESEAEQIAGSIQDLRATIHQI